MPWRRAWQPTAVFLSGKSHGHRSLVGYSPWGCRDSDTIEATEHIIMLKWWTSLSCVLLFATPWTVHGIFQVRMLEWVAFPFARGSSQPRDWTQVSHIAGGFFTSWARGKVHYHVGWYHGDVNIDQCVLEKLPGAASIVEEKNKALSPWTLAFSPEPPSSWCFRSFPVIEKSSEVCPSAEHKGYVSNSLRPHGLQSTRLLCPWDSPGKSTVVGCHSLLQGIFPTHGSNLYFLHFRQILFTAEPLGKPKHKGIGNKNP